MISKATKTVKAVVKRVTTSIKNAVKSGVNRVRQVVKTVKKAVNNAKTAIKTAVIRRVATIKKNIQTAVIRGKAAAKKIVTQVKKKATVAIATTTATAASVVALGLALINKRRKEKAEQARKAYNNLKKYINSEIAKMKPNVKIDDDDVVKTTKVTYVDPDSGVQHGVEFVINETKQQIISQKGWGNVGEFENSLKKYGGVTPKNIERQFADHESNGQANSAPEHQDTSKAIGNATAGILNSLVRQEKINSSIKTEFNTMFGKEYKKELTENKREEKEKKKKKQKIKKTGACKSNLVTMEEEKNNAN